MKRVAVGFLLCSSFLWAGSGPKPSESLVITNVNVVDTRYGEIEPNLTVIVKDGLIEGITKVAVINTGAHVRVVNASGKYLIPGLWDMNAHLSGPAAAAWSRKSLFALYLANGVTGIRNMDARVDGRLLPAGDLRPEIEAAEPLGGSRPEPASPAPALSQRRTIEDLNEVLLACSAQEKELRDGDLDALANSDLATHAYIGSAMWETYDSNKAHDLFIRIADQATWMVPSLVSVEPPPPDSAEDTPWVRYAPARYRNSQSHLDTATVLEQMAEAQRDIRLVGDMRRAGVQFLTGTNAPSPQLFPGFALHRELDLLVQSGFTALQALQASTFNPALYMLKLDKYGVVEPGHVADLVLLDENPLDDIANTHKVAGVVLRGTYLPRADLDAMLRRVEQEANQQTGAAKAADTNNDQPTHSAPGTEIRHR